MKWRTQLNTDLLHEGIDAKSQATWSWGCLLRGHCHVISSSSLKPARISSQQRYWNAASVRLFRNGTILLNWSFPFQNVLCRLLNKWIRDRFGKVKNWKIELSHETKDKQEKTTPGCYNIHTEQSPAAPSLRFLPAHHEFSASANGDEWVQTTNRRAGARD